MTTATATTHLERPGVARWRALVPRRPARPAQELTAERATDVAVAYAAFALCAVLPVFAGSAGEVAAVMNLPGAFAGAGGGVGALLGWALVGAALGSLLVPRAWKHSSATLVWLTPLLVTFAAALCVLVAQLQVVHSVVAVRLDQASSLFGAGPMDLPEVGPYHVGLGAYATLAVAAYIALRGVQHWSRPGH